MSNPLAVALLYFSSCILSVYLTVFIAKPNSMNVFGSVLTLLTVFFLLSTLFFLVDWMLQAKKNKSFLFLFALTLIVQLLLIVGALYGLFYFNSGMPYYYDLVIMYFVFIVLYSIFVFYKTDFKK